MTTKLVKVTKTSVRAINLKSAIRIKMVAIMIEMTMTGIILMMTAAMTMTIQMVCKLSRSMASSSIFELGFKLLVRNSIFRKLVTLQTDLKFSLTVRNPVVLEPQKCESH